MRAVAPIARTFNQPFEKRMFGHALEHPVEVIAIIRCETEFGSVRIITARASSVSRDTRRRFS